MSNRWAVFLDRDGILNEPVLDRRSGRFESPYRSEDVRLVPGAIDAVRRLKALGASVAVCSNQPAAAKGEATLECLEAVHEEIVRQLADGGAEVDVWRYCHHHPAGIVPALGHPCDCRKPAPGMLLSAAATLDVPDLERCFMIGDSDVDVEAGRRAGCRTILVEQPRTAHRRAGAALPHVSVATVDEAAIIVEFEVIAREGLHA